MGFAVSSNITSLMTNIAQQLQEGQEVEEMSPEELLDMEALKELAQQGVMHSEGKSYLFEAQGKAALAESVNQYLSETNQPEQSKHLQANKNHLTPSSKENLAKEKNFKLLSSPKGQTENSSKEQREARSQTFSKTDQTSRESLQKAALPKSAAQLRENPSLKQNQTQANTLQHRIQKEFAETREKKETKESRPHEQKNKSENAKELVENQFQRSEKNEEKEHRDQKQRNKEDEEGFAQGEHQQQSQDSQEDENSKKINATERVFSKEIVTYGYEDSILSEIFNMRVSQFDVLILFIEIMKIEIRSREQEMLARREERELQLVHMQSVVESYKTQGYWMWQSSFSAGVLGIVSGVCPILGHTSGKWIIQKLGGFFSSLKDMNKDQFFKSLSKMTYSMSEMSKSTGQVQQLYSQSSIHFNEQMGSIHRMDWEENTRSLEEIKDSWKGIENFLYQSLQMYHDAIRQLYS